MVVRLHQRVVKGRAVVRKSGIHATEVQVAVAVHRRPVVHPTTVREDVCESTFASELAVALPSSISNFPLRTEGQILSNL
jgi:hypothetical protein